VFPRRYCQAHLLKWAPFTSRPTLLLSEVANWWKCIQSLTFICV
jgi:hypothetical protein